MYVGAQSMRWATLALLLLVGSMRVGGASTSDTAPRDWFHVITLEDSTYAVSEPKSLQQNVSYLLVGSESALLFDSGPGVYSIRRVVESLTKLPVLVIPSHLHFDHIGRIGEFAAIALVAATTGAANRQSEHAGESLRRQASGGVLTLTPKQCLLRTPCSFHIARWLMEGEVIDLGDRHVAVLSTPGHTPDSLTLVDRERGQMLTGDLINRDGTLYDVPGSDLTQVVRSLERLAEFARRGYVAYEAHSERAIPPDLFLKVRRVVLGVMAGRGTGKPVCLDGVPARQFMVSGFTVIL